MPLQLRDERMSVDEYYAYTGEERVELIDGYLYDMSSPSRAHQAILRELVKIIDTHIKEKCAECLVYPAPFGVQLKESEDTVVEPDISVICDRSKLTDRGCLGAPDLIIEIASPTSIAHDYVKKLKLYFAAGVKEYWIVNSSDRSVTVYKLAETAVADSYVFDDSVPLSICNDFSIDFTQIDNVLKEEGLK